MRRRPLYEPRKAEYAAANKPDTPAKRIPLAAIFPSDSSVIRAMSRLFSAASVGDIRAKSGKTKYSAYVCHKIHDSATNRSNQTTAHLPTCFLILYAILQKCQRFTAVLFLYYSRVRASCRDAADRVRDWRCRAGADQRDVSKTYYLSHQMRKDRKARKVKGLRPLTCMLQCIHDGEDLSCDANCCPLFGKNWLRQEFCMKNNYLFEYMGLGKILLMRQIPC